MGLLKSHYDDAVYVLGAACLVAAGFIIAPALGFATLGVALIALAFFLGGS